MVIIKTGILNAFGVLRNLAFDDRLICSGVIMTAFATVRRWEPHSIPNQSITLRTRHKC